MESNPEPTLIALRIEPEELRERRNALRLKACPFCGGTFPPIGRDMVNEQVT